MIDIINIEDYENKIKKHIEGSFYRGQSDTTYKNLSCGIIRNNGFTRNEDKIVCDTLIKRSEDFKNLNLPIEHLAKMQHYGIPTRLIDISISPLIALYFAVENTMNLQDGEVFVFTQNGYDFNSKEVNINALVSRLRLYDLDIIKNEYFKVYQENLSNQEILECVSKNIFVKHSEKLKKTSERLYKQEGTFIVCGNKVINGCIQDEVLSIEKSEAKEIIRIPFEYKEQIKRELDNKYKINESYVYPELTSFSNYLRDIYKEEKFNLNGTFIVKKEEDISTSIKRKSIFIVINIRLRISEMKKIIYNIIQKNKILNDVVWVYMANNDEDYIMCNWVLRGMWINKKLDEDNKPIVTGDLDEDNIVWNINKEFLFLHEYYNENNFEDDVSLLIKNKKSYEVLKVKYNELVIFFVGGNFEKFEMKLNEYREIISNEYFLFGNYGYSRDIELVKYLEYYQIFASNVHNLVVCYDNGTKFDKKGLYLYNLYIKEIDKYTNIIDESYFLWEKKLNIN